MRAVNLRALRYVLMSPIGQNHVLLPSPRREQDLLAQLIESSTGDISRNISLAERGIALLSEHRVRLIAGVVTGKRDFRGFPLSEINDCEKQRRSRRV